MSRFDDNIDLLNQKTWVCVFFLCPGEKKKCSSCLREFIVMFIKNILNCLRLKYSLCFISNISIRDVLGGKIPRHFMLHFNTLWFHVILFHGAVIHNVTSWLRRISACGSKDQSWETLSKTYKWYSLYLQLKTAISGFTDQFVFSFLDHRSIWPICIV